MRILSRILSYVGIAFMTLLATPASAQVVSNQPYDVTLSGRENTRDTLHFRIHYTTSGDDETNTEYVDAVAKALEKSWQIEIETMGWAVPPTDGGRGGNSLYDVYIRDLTGTSALGITSPEDNVGDNPSTPAVESWAATSYLSIDNHLTDEAFSKGQDEFSLMRTTVAHEFNHAIQFGYDIADSHNWIYEATATWMETETVGHDQDATGYVPDVFANPGICFGSVAHDDDSRLHYGDWLFIDHLAQEFGEKFIPELWGFVADYEGFESLERALATKGTTLEDEMATYYLRNLTRDYRLGDLFHATVHTQGIIDNPATWSYKGAGVQELGANYFAFIAEPGVYRVELTRDNGTLRLWGIGVIGQKVDTFDLYRGGVIDTSGYDYFYLMVFNPSYDSDVDQCSAVGYDLRIQASDEQATTVFRTFNGKFFQPLALPQDKSLSLNGAVKIYL